MDLDKFIIDYGHYLNQGWEPSHILVPLPTYFSLPLPLPHASTDTLSVTIGSIAFSRSEVKSLSHVQLFVTPWTVAHQAPLSMGFSRQEYWSGLPFPSPGIFPTQESNPGLLQSYGFSSSQVWMWELDYKESWVLKNWCFWTVVLEKTLESLRQQGDPTSQFKGNQSWIFIGRIDAELEASILWPADAKSWLTGKDLYAGKDGEQEEKGMTEDEMVGWHHWFGGHEFEQTLEDSEGQVSLTCYSLWGHKESVLTGMREV